MPPQKCAKSLTELCIDSLTKFIVRSLDPQYLFKLKKYKPDYDGRSKFHVNIRSIRKISNILRETNRHQLNKNDVHKCQKSKDPKEKCEKFDSSATSSVDMPSNCSNPHTQTTPLSPESSSLSDQVEESEDLSLSELLFAAILPELNLLYVKSTAKSVNQDMRKLIKLLVPLFVNYSLKVLNFGAFKMFTEASMFQLLYNRLSKATSLEKLIFDRSCYWRAESILEISKMLKGLSTLHTLHIHYICQPDMLQGLAESCPQLRELSLKGSKDITDNEVPLLSKFKLIETLDITGTTITGRGCRTLVLEMPLLTWLTHCPFNCNSDTLIFESRAQLFTYIKDQLHKQTPSISSSGNSVDVPKEVVTDSESLPDNNNDSDLSKENNFEIKEKEKNLSLKLKFFWLFNSTTEEVFLTHLCPKLEHLRLDFVLQDLPELPDMEAITHLSCLSKLSLYAFDRCPIQLVTNVIEFSPQITTLHLHLGDEWFFVAPVVNVIAQNCRNLTHLKMEGDYKGHHSIEESDERLDFTIPPGGLSNLQEARLAGCVTDQRVLHLLEQAPNLEILNLDGELEWLHDDTFTDAVNRNLLLKLKELWFNVSAGVTLGCVRHLLQSKNELERIGRLCLVSSSTKEGYTSLLQYIRKHNLLTELIWVTDQRDFTLDDSETSNSS
ncbi:hypothetical protein Anas_09059 [Armadillidium nasatum]|uniref:Uncharacterized protein n=1 Tax=Armadillidium nasatum TaxID=96803 RepID=A0A5N5SLV2_9CRUS|nr:hypothetical protein Anas_09059 [Armadillidium nasatum]